MAFWTSFFCSFMPEIIKGITIVVHSTCDSQMATFQVNGPVVDFIGNDDLHDRKYDEHEITADFDSSFATSDNCVYSISLYPSDELTLQEGGTDDNTFAVYHPVIWTIAVILIFVAVSLVFGFYDYIVERRQQKVLTTAVRSSTLVNSLFPATFRDRLLDAATEQQHHMHHQQQQTAAQRRQLKKQRLSSQQQQLPQQEQESKSQQEQKNSSEGDSIDDSGAVRADTVVEGGKHDKPGNGETKNNDVVGTGDSNENTQEDESAKYAIPSSLQFYSSKPIAELFPHATVLFGK